MSRAYSPAPSQMGSMMFQPPAYQSGPHSGRNTPMGYNMTGNSQHSNFYPQQQTRASNYIGMDIPRTKSPEDADIWDGPSDAELERAVQELLRDADLNTITKREIRKRMEEGFNMDLTSRKATINAAIDRVLLSHA
jgi:chitin synthase